MLIQNNVNVKKEWFMTNLVKHAKNAYCIKEAVLANVLAQQKLIILIIYA